jgi:hypothetical protein
MKGDSPVAMIAENCRVDRVENGWVVTAYCAGTNMMLVAKSIDEVVGFLRGMEWQTPRPLPYGDSTGAWQGTPVPATSPR